MGVSTVLRSYLIVLDVLVILSLPFLLLDFFLLVLKVILD